MLQYATKRRSALFHLGKCAGCAGPKSADRISKMYCSSCSGYKADWLRRLRQERTKKGLCTLCGKPNATGVKMCVGCRRRTNALNRARRTKDKEAVLAHYGRECRCCGEGTEEFLTVDHIGGGGTAHRAADRLADQNIWRWLVKHGFPRGYRIACFNCNQATSGGRRCPHKRRSR